MHRDRFVAAQCVDLLVRFTFDADGGHVDADRLREIRAHGGNVRRQLRALGDDDGIDVRDRVACGADDRDRAFQQLDAVRAFPFRICVGKVLPDIAGGCRAENCVGHRMTQHVRVRVARKAGLVRNSHASNNERPAGFEAMQVVPGSHSTG